MSFETSIFSGLKVTSLEISSLSHCVDSSYDGADGGISGNCSEPEAPTLLPKLCNGDGDRVSPLSAALSGLAGPCIRLLLSSSMKHKEKTQIITYKDIRVCVDRKKTLRYLG